MDADQASQSGPSEPPKNKMNKAPPIFTVKISISVIIKTIMALNIPKTAFLIKEIDTENHTIYVNCINHHKTICDKLREFRIQFYSFTPKHMKLKSIILKGIRGDFSVEDIRKEIEELELPNIKITNLSRFVFNKSQPDKFHFLLQLSSDSKSAELFKIKALAYQKVKWEHLRKPDLFECKNCQRVGHASKNCNLQYRCVKSAQSHVPGVCNISSLDNRAALTCANCKQAGHPTSYKGCPFVKFALNKKREHKESQTRKKLQTVNTIAACVRDNTSFAQAVRNSNPQRHATVKDMHTSAPDMKLPRPQTPRGIKISYDDYHQPSPSTNWVDDFKSEIAALVTKQFQSLASQIAANTAKIEFIFNTLLSNYNE